MALWSRRDLLNSLEVGFGLVGLGLIGPFAPTLTWVIPAVLEPAVVDPGRKFTLV